MEANPENQPGPAPQQGPGPLQDILPTPASHPQTNQGETRPARVREPSASIEETRPFQAAGLDPQEGQPPSPEGQTTPDGAAALPDAAAPVKPASEPAPPETEGPQVETAKGSRAWLWFTLLGLILLALVASGSAWGGYRSGIAQRNTYENTLISQEAKTQFDLGVQDMEAGRYDLARQRFEYVIQLNPNYPEVTEKLALVLLELNTTATPTLAPTPTLTPTPDLRSRDELFLQAQALLFDEDWNGAIDALLALRKQDPSYLAVRVDGMLYVALRNLGVDKIARQADLEGGTYDLALAEGFGPLDVEARNWRDWAELYIRGASYWDVDWAQAVFYFGQLAPMAPNLMDGSRWTATDRYYQALLGYGDWLSRQGRWCEAQEQYQAALNLRNDPQVQPTATYAAEQCASPPEELPAFEITPSPEGTIFETPTPTEQPPPPEETPTPYP